MSQLSIIELSGGGPGGRGELLSGMSNADGYTYTNSASATLRLFGEENPSKYSFMALEQGTFPIEAQWDAAPRNFYDPDPEDDHITIAASVFAASSPDGIYDLWLRFFDPDTDTGGEESVVQAGSGLVLDRTSPPKVFNIQVFNCGLDAGIRTIAMIWPEFYPGAPPDQIEANMRRFIVERRYNAAAFTPIGFVSPTSAALAGETSDSTQASTQYRIRAQDKAGNLGPYSDVITFTAGSCTPA